MPAFVSSVDHRIDLGTLAPEPAATLRMNDIGAVSLQLLRPMAVDVYRDNRATGALILIDAETNATVAAGMIVSATGVTGSGEEEEAEAWGRVTAGEREARWGHRGGVLELSGPADLIDAIERSLFAVGAVTSRIDADNSAFLIDPNLVATVAELQSRSGLLSLVIRPNEEAALTARAEGNEISLDTGNPMQAVAAVHELLRNAGIFISSEMADL